MLPSLLAHIGQTPLVPFRPISRELAASPRGV
jgi:hypothetical protein